MAWVDVIPKEGLVRVAAPILLLVWHQLFRFFFGGGGWKSLIFFLKGYLVWHRLRPLGTFLRDASQMCLASLNRQDRDLLLQDRMVFTGNLSNIFLKCEIKGIFDVIFYHETRVVFWAEKQLNKIHDVCFKEHNLKHMEFSLWYLTWSLQIFKRYYKGMAICLVNLARHKTFPVHCVWGKL